MKKKVLITVKTYPRPSQKYGELVCTAGITDRGEWIRLFPMPFRDMPFGQQYSKFDWIECNVRKRTDDPRRESYSPINQDEDIAIVDSIPAARDWADRKHLLLPLLSPSVEELREKCSDGVSLGLIKPRKIERIYAVDTEREWTGKEKQALLQTRLFGPEQKPLEKIPYVFHYQYLCQGDECNGHDMQIDDWEIYALYLSERGKKGERQAKESVIKKLQWMTERDLHLFLGTTKSQHHRKSFMIIGLFYPPVVHQRSLFE